MQTELACRRSMHKISRLKMLPTLGVPTWACCSMPSDSHSNGHSTFLRQRQQSRTSSLCSLPRAQGPCRWKARFAPAPPALARVHRAWTCRDGAGAAIGGKEEGVRVCPRDEGRPHRVRARVLALGCDPRHGSRQLQLERAQRACVLTRACVLRACVLRAERQDLAAFVVCDAVLAFAVLRGRGVSFESYQKWFDDGARYPC